MKTNIVPKINECTEKGSPLTIEIFIMLKTLNVFTIQDFGTGSQSVTVLRVEVWLR